MSLGAAVLTGLALTVQLPSEMSATDRKELLEACSNTLSSQTCVESAGGENADAHVERLGGSRYALDVELTSERRTRSASRELLFSEADAPDERARALGLSLGLMARNLLPLAEREGDAPSDDDAATQQQASSAPGERGDDSNAQPQQDNERSRDTEPARSQRATHAMLVADGTLSIDPSLGRVFAGPSLSAWLFVTPQFAVSLAGQFLFGSIRSATPGAGAPVQSGESQAPLAVRRIGPWLGVAYMYPLHGRAQTFRLGGHLQLGMENLRVSGTQLQNPASRWSAQMRLSLPLMWNPVPALCVHAALQLTITPSPTRLLIDESQLGTAGYVLPGAALGLGYTF